LTIIMSLGIKGSC